MDVAAAAVVSEGYMLLGVDGLIEIKAQSIWLFNSEHALLHVQEIKVKLLVPRKCWNIVGNSHIFHASRPIPIQVFLMSAVIWNNALCVFCRQTYGPVCILLETMTACDEVTPHGECVVITAGVPKDYLHSLPVLQLTIFWHVSVNVHSATASQGGPESRKAEQVTALTA